MQPNAKKQVCKLRVCNHANPFLIGPKLSTFVGLVNAQQLVTFVDRWKYPGHGLEPGGFLVRSELANPLHFFNGPFGNVFAFKFAQVREF